MTFFAGVIVGTIVALIVIAFLALDAYDRGYKAALATPWRAELAARRRAERSHPLAA